MGWMEQLIVQALWGMESIPHKADYFPLEYGNSWPYMITCMDQ